MDKKTLTIFLSILLLISFFLPFVSNGPFSLSAFHIVFGKGEMEGISNRSNSLYISLLIPLSAIVLLIGTVTNDNFTKSGIVLWLPLIGVIYIAVMTYVTASYSLTIPDLIGLFSYGFWFSLSAAIIMPFLKRDDLPEEA